LRTIVYGDVDLETNIYYDHKTYKPLMNFFKRIYNNGLKQTGFNHLDLKFGLTGQGIGIDWTF